MFQLFERLLHMFFLFFPEGRQENMVGAAVTVQHFALYHTLFLHAVEHRSKRPRFDLTGRGNFFLAGAIVIF